MYKQIMCFCAFLVPMLPFSSSYKSESRQILYLTCLHFTVWAARDHTKIVSCLLFQIDCVLCNHHSFLIKIQLLLSALFTSLLSVRKCLRKYFQNQNMMGGGERRWLN